MADVLPRQTGFVLTGQVAFEHLEVLTLDRGDVVVVADEAGGFDAVDIAVELLHAPVEGYAVLIVVPVAVEPDALHIAIAGEQLAHLVLHKGEVGVVVGFQRAAGEAAGTAYGVVVAYPVENGVVEMQAHTLLMASVGQFLQHIAAEGGGIHDIVAVLGGMEHGEAVVVTRGEGDVAGARLTYGLHPLLGIEPHGIEAGGRLGVLVFVELAGVEIPLTLGKLAVDAPVEEDAETEALKLFAGLKVLGGGHILCPNALCGCQAKTAQAGCKQ